MKFALTPLQTLALAFGLATSARATDQTSHEKAAACDGFAWSVSSERAWFGAKTLSGASFFREGQASDFARLCGWRGVIM